MKTQINPALLAVLYLLTSCTSDAPVVLKPAVLAETVEFMWDTEEAAKLYQDATGTRIFPMVKGDTHQLIYQITPEQNSLTYPDVVWNSTDPGVVTVNKDGVLTAWAAGESVVTLKTVTINLGAVASLKVKVSENFVKATSISITDNHELVDDQTGVPMCAVGETLQMQATVNPPSATYRTVFWNTSDRNIATVDPYNGLLTGVSAGDVEVIAKAIDGGGVIARKKIKVGAVIEPEGIKVTNMPELSSCFSLSDVDYQLEFSIYPENATKSRVQWTSSDESVATVDKKGKVTFVKYGKATITANCQNASEVLPEGYVRSFSVSFDVPAGFYRDHFLRNDAVCHWELNKDHVKSGAKQSVMYDEATAERYLLFTPFIKNNQGRGDIMRNKYTYDKKTYLSRDYPVLCFRFDDVNDRASLVDGEPVSYPRQINLDTSGSLEDGTAYTGNVGGDNNKWLMKYRCSDGSAIIVYDLSQQKFSKNNTLMPEGQVGTFTTFQIKYADINKGEPIPAVKASDVTYRFFWFHTFKSIKEMDDFLVKWSEKTKITYLEPTYNN